MYKTTNIILKNSDKQLKIYCKKNCQTAKLFKNSVIFRIRQLMSAKNKEFKDLHKLEQQVIDEFKLTEPKYKEINNKYYLPNYNHLDYLFKTIKNNDYYNVVDVQSSQQIIKEVLQDFKSFFVTAKDYKTNPSKYTGRPKLPHYIKSDEISFTLTNQSAKIKIKNDRTWLKFPKTDLILELGNLKFGKLVEVVIKPYYDTYKICIVTEEDEINPIKLNKNKILGIDIGLDNIIATSNNCGLTPFIIKGNDIKSFNQWYNKLLSKYQSELPEDIYNSKRIKNLSMYRHNRISDQFNKIASYVVHYCIDNKIGTIVIGKNNQWKTSINIGKSNNQKFCHIPHAGLINKIECIANYYKIDVVKQEESYTSKASFLDNDELPDYDSSKKYKFSGKRIYRGLYKSASGILLNADINGASNIIRKYKFNAFKNIRDFSYLYNSVKVVNVNS